MEKINILVCAHQSSNLTRNGGVYKAIQAGKALHPELDLGFITDAEGDNISDKNQRFCELTVLYWGWKNIKDVENCGLNHHRRYFDMKIDEKNIDKIMGDCDMLVVKSKNMLSRHERANNLMLMTSKEDFYLFQSIFLKKYPQYKITFFEYFYNSKVSYPYQMFISKKDIYDDYCSFMFPVLFELEKIMKHHGYSRQERAIGYIGEWFLGLYISCKQLKVKNVPIIDYSYVKLSSKQSLKQKILASCYRKLVGICDFFYPNNATFTIPDDVKVGFSNDHIII